MQKARPKRQRGKGVNVGPLVHQNHRRRESTFPLQHFTESLIHNLLDIKVDLRAKRYNIRRKHLALSWIVTKLRYTGV